MNCYELKFIFLLNYHIVFFAGVLCNQSVNILLFYLVFTLTMVYTIANCQQLKKKKTKSSLIKKKIR